MSKNNLIKKYTLLLILTCISTVFYAQDKPRKHYFGNHVSWGKSSYSGSVYTKNYFTAGFDYALYITDITELHTGLSITSDKKLFLLSVPLSLKVHFLKYLFIDSGVNFNNHIGIGVGTGIGAEYTFKPGIAISAGYQLQWKFFDLFSQQKNSVGVDILNQRGIIVGVGYRF